MNGQFEVTATNWKLWGTSSTRFICPSGLHWTNYQYTQSRSFLHSHWLHVYSVRRLVLWSAWGLVTNFLVLCHVDIIPITSLPQRQPANSFLKNYKGWWMVPRKSWVSENFSPISESRQRFYRVSEGCFFLFGSEIASISGSDFQARVSASLGFYHSPPLLQKENNEVTETISNELNNLKYSTVKSALSSLLCSVQQVYPLEYSIALLGPCLVTGHVPTLPWVRLRVG